MRQRLISKVFFILVLLHVVGLASLGWIFHRSIFGTRTIPEDARSVTIPAGATLSDTLDQLHRLKVAPPRGMTRLAIRLFKPSLVIKKGIYHLPEQATTWHILLMLDRGDVALFKLTLREGLDKWETARELGQTQWGEEADFLALIEDPELISAHDPQAADLEGYLFPETYFFGDDATPKDIVASLVNEFLSQTETMRAQLKHDGLTLREWVTLASLVEKETARPDERFTIAGVFAGRLARGMLLQCDPTIIYALKDMGLFRGKIFRSQILVDHPYNTYVYPGLPPGPIASPGIEALRAAFDPPQHGFLYFVSRNDGTHYFSRALKEHQRAVRRYQRGR